MDNASSKRDILFNSFDDSGFWGNSSFDRRHVFNFYYIYDLPFFQKDTASLKGRVLGGWQISGSTFMRTGTPLWVTRTDDVAGTGDPIAQPYNLVGDPNANSNGQLSNSNTDQNFWFNPRPTRARRPARSATRRATTCTARASTSGTSRSSRTSR